MRNLFSEAVLVRAIDPWELLTEMRRLVRERADGAPSIDFIMGYAQALCLTGQIGTVHWSQMLRWARKVEESKLGGA